MPAKCSVKWCKQESIQGYSWDGKESFNLCDKHIDEYSKLKGEAYECMKRLVNGETTAPQKMISSFEG